MICALTSLLVTFNLWGGMFVKINGSNTNSVAVAVFKNDRFSLTSHCYGHFLPLSHAQIIEFIFLFTVFKLNPADGLG